MPVYEEKMNISAPPSTQDELSGLTLSIKVRRHPRSPRPRVEMHQWRLRRELGRAQKDIKEERRVGEGGAERTDDEATKEVCSVLVGADQDVWW